MKPLLTDAPDKFNIKSKAAFQKGTPPAPAAW